MRSSRVRMTIKIFDRPNTTPTGGVHTIVRPWNKWLKSVENYRNWGSRSQPKEEIHGAVMWQCFCCRWLELNFLHCSYYLYNYFRQTVQWSMILESSISNGVVCWTESFTMVISSIKRTRRWMFCKTKLITCELTAGKTNGCSIVVY